MAERSTVDSVPLPPALIELETKIKAQPNDVALLLEFAEKNIEEAKHTGEVGHLMRAVQSYSKVLQIDPGSGKALLGMANVSFESGVFDKARDYYDRLLEVEPGNLKARTDLALVLLQLGENQEALTRLEKLCQQNPDYFPSRLSLALARKLVGDKSGAKETALIAAKLAPDDEGRLVVSKFLEGIDKPTDVKPTTDEHVSPAIAIDQFFRNHQIVGPKLVQIRWTGPNSADVRLKEFPMDKMPPFARDKFIASVRAVLSGLPGEPTTLKIVDAETDVVMEEISPR
jgi:tetratricopeptide (TPR) repeat protein